MNNTAHENMKELERFQRIDHDTLIRLETKVDILVSTLQKLQDGLNLRVTAAEQRLGSLEKLRDEVNLSKMVTQVEDNTQEIHDFKLTYKIIVAIASVISTLIGFGVSSLVRFW